MTHSIPRFAWFQVRQSHVRRGASFLVGVSIPVIVAGLAGQSRAALLGGIAGLVLSFADNEKGLLGRLAQLFGAAGCLAAGGVAGYFLSGTPAIFWPVFIAIVFGVGMAARGGKELLVTTRYGAVAFTGAAGLPPFDTYDAKILALALSVAVAFRVADHLVFGPLPRSSAAPKPQRPAGHAGWIRFALAYAVASAAALWVGLTLEPLRAVWVVTTTLIVMQADARSSYQRIVERIAGTFAGVLLAWVIATLVSKSASVPSIAAAGFSEPWALCILALIAAPFIPHHIGQRYWLHTALIALFILLMYGYAAPSIHELDTLLGERLKDMLLGCAIAVAGTAVAFPRAREVAGDDDAADT